MIFREFMKLKLHIIMYRQMVFEIFGWTIFIINVQIMFQNERRI